MVNLGGRDVHVIPSPLGIGIVLIGRAGPGVNNVIQGLYDHLQA